MLDKKLAYLDIESFDEDENPIFLTWEDEEEIADQMERMGGGNLIGRKSPYENTERA